MLARASRLLLSVAVFGAACGKNAPAHAPDAAGTVDAGIPDTALDSPLDSAIDAAPEPEIPDTTPPNLLAITPAAGSSAWLHEPIRFELDEQIVAPGLQVSATLAGTPIPATVAIDSTGEAIVVTIGPDVRGVGALAVSLSGDIADLEGNVMTVPLAVELAMPAWSVPAVDRGVATSSPAVVVAGAGDLIAAWEVGGIGARRVAVSRHDRGAWHALGDALGAADTSSASLAVDDSGRPVVAWIEAGTAQVQRWDGAAWQPLASPGVGSQVVVAGAKPTIAVFGASVAVRELVGDVWQPVGGELAVSGAITSAPALAVTSTSVAVGWVEGGGILRTHRFTSSWTPLEAIAVGAGARISVAARGQTVAVAWDQLGSTSNVYAAVTDATAWTRLGGALDVDVAGDAFSPAIAIDAAGAAIVAWHERIEGAERGVTARWSNGWQIVGGKSWLASSLLPSAPKLALYADRIPVVSWSVGGVANIARLNGPAVASFGIETRPSLAGCAFSAAAPPAQLVLTGCFTIPAAGKPVPHAGLVPYDINAELWSDGTKKRRWIALPEGQTMTASGTGAWAAPEGTVIVKEFAIETTPGSAWTRKAVETRFLVKTATDWQGFTYKWRADGLNADLIFDQAQTVTWTLDGGGTYQHYYPSRTQCRSCHHTSYGPLLGVRPEQLNRWFDYNGTIAEQIPTLAHLGIGPATAPTPFPSPHDSAHSLDRRVRGYMAANCAHCHNSQYISIKDLRITTPLAQTRLCEVIVPGDPVASRLHTLVTQRPGMPPLGTLLVDPLAGALIDPWIQQMTSCP